MIDLEKLFITDNPIFSGGLSLAVVAAGAQFIRSGGRVAIEMIRKRVLVTLEITSKDKSYPWVLQWLYARGNMTRHLSVKTSLNQATSNSSTVKIDFVPGPGQHLFNYKGQFMLVQRIRDQQMLDLNSGIPWEKIQFTTYGQSTEIFQSILTEAFDLCMREEEGKTLIFTSWGADWRQFGQPRKKRPMHSVILDSGISDRLLSDVHEWLNASAWYSDRGIPYRRGYLLYGPPGSGKSSFIMALAGKLDYNICILNLAERGLTDERLAQALSNIPQRSLVLLEDIDAAFPSRKGESQSNANSSQMPMHSLLNHCGSDVTFSGLLNVLDGVAASEERLVFMTTNFIDALDPALIRPGRVDFVQLIGDATDYQIKELFKRFYPEADNIVVDCFASELRKVKPTISMAALQGYLLRNKNDSVSAMQNILQLSQNALDQTPRHMDYKNEVGGTQSPTRQARRRLTVEEIDKMYFNPQEGWESMLTANKSGKGN